MSQFSKLLREYGERVEVEGFLMCEDTLAEAFADAVKNGLITLPREFTGYVVDLKGRVYKEGVCVAFLNKGCGINELREFLAQLGQSLPYYDEVAMMVEAQQGGPAVVAYNFSEEHAPKVEDRTKRRTLRRTARARVGDRLQLYTGQRTPQCRKLSEVDPVCTLVASVGLYPEGIVYDGHWQTKDTCESYAVADGFASYADMYAWFKAKYGEVPYPLYETRWAWPEQKPSEVSDASGK